ncbi:MAG: MFS transporter [Anaerolineae bacterium]|nr:MFS transporter [Anaerolineae bacterium]
MTVKAGGDPARLAAFRYRDFRLLWSGQLLSATGSQMQLIAVNWHVFALLRDQTFAVNLLGREVLLGGEALGLGTLGLVRILPVFLFALMGGMLADSRDRRKLLIWAHMGAALFAGMLAILTLSGNESLVVLYLLTAADAAMSALVAPAEQSLVPNIVAREHVANAISLNTLLWYLATTIGPALAGIIVGQLGVGVVYAINAVSFSAVIIMLLLMQYRGKAVGQGSGMSWAALKEGFQFTYHERMIWSTMLLDFLATFFSSARTMLPIVATDILGLGVEGYGFLATAQPVGAVIAGVVLALRKDIHRQGVVLLASVAVYGLATALFGLSTSIVLSYFLFGLTGAGDTVSTVIRGTIRQLMTPDRLRGRMTGVNMLFFSGGPQLGELEAGLVAALFGAPVAIVTGGLATVLLTGWIAWEYPRLRRYTSDDFRQAEAANA